MRAAPNLADPSVGGPARHTAESRLGPLELTMLTPSSLARDSAITAVLMTVGALVLGGVGWGVGVLSGAILSLVHLYFMSVIVRRFVTGQLGGVALLLPVKSLAAGFGLVALLGALEPLPVMTGVLVVVVSVAAHGALGLVRPVVEAQEA
jgi:hypothetical protein